jgi:hypothetical protein
MAFSVTCYKLHEHHLAALKFDRFPETTAKMKASLFLTGMNK